jgi:hypothetical protein
VKNDAHPGRSIDFLSRLHDGELSAGERARFESHRAHCAECRRAAAEFESALSLYRSASTSPASPDLAGRILRRLQTAAPARRRPFGIFHGIDVRWAGAFAAALLAMIIGSAVVVRQQTAPGAKAPATPIPVRLGKSAEQTQAANAAPPAAQDRRMADAAPRRNDADAGAARESKTVVDLLETAGRPADDRFEESEPRAAPPAAPAAAAAAPKEKDAERPVSERQEGVAGRIASRDEASGGERSAAAAPDLAAAASDVAIRLEITALDGEGTPPRTLRQPELSPAHRGRSYELVVSASGQVLHVLPREEETRLRAQQESAKRQKLEQSPVPEELTGLRFETGNRPRRLLLTVR